jgi:hypothetical protein
MNRTAVRLAIVKTEKTDELRCSLLYARSEDKRFAAFLGYALASELGLDDQENR